MKQVAKNRFLVILVGLLLVSNLAMLLFFVVLKPEPSGSSTGRDREKPGDYLKRQLNLTAEQDALFKQYREEHKEGVKMLFDSLRASKNHFYGHISNPDTPDSVLEANASEIGDWQKQIDLRLFRHFQKLRKACNKDQQLKFDTLVNKMINRPWNKKGDKPDGDKHK